MTAVFVRRLGGALTDLGYLLLAAVPSLRAGYRWWARDRYLHLAPRYATTIRDDPAYFAPLQALLRTLETEQPAIVADVGAGTGGATALLARRYPGALLTAIDVSPLMLARLQAGGAVRVRRVVGDAFALPLRSATADLVLVHNAPFDVPELLRVAAPCGTVAVVLSSGAILSWWMRRLRPRLAGRSAGWPCIRELRAQGGIAWIFRRTPVDGASEPGPATAAGRSRWRRWPSASAGY